MEDEREHYKTKGRLEVRAGETGEEGETPDPLFIATSGVKP
jgi:hypothetical protein